jgi:hypothetical protein
VSNYIDDPGTETVYYDEVFMEDEEVVGETGYSEDPFHQQVSQLQCGTLELH